MARHIQKNEGRSVSLEDYEAGRAWRATTAELEDALGRDPEEITLEEHVGRFTLRLLNPDRTGAIDRFVQLAVMDRFSDEPGGDGLVTVRPVVDDETGRAESHQITSDGIIVDPTDGSNPERGYFVSGPSIGGDELGNHAMQELIPKETPALKAMSMELPG